MLLLGSTRTARPVPSKNSGKITPIAASIRRYSARAIQPFASPRPSKCDATFAGSSSRSRSGCAATPQRRANTNSGARIDPLAFINQPAINQPAPNGLQDPLPHLVGRAPVVRSDRKTARFQDAKH